MAMMYFVIGETFQRNELFNNGGYFIKEFYPGNRYNISKFIGKAKMDFLKYCLKDSGRS